MLAIWPWSPFYFECPLRYLQSQQHSSVIYDRIKPIVLLEYQIFRPNKVYLMITTNDKTKYNLGFVEYSQQICVEIVPIQGVLFLV